MPFGVLFSVFALALLGGVHCAAMCGGIAMAAEQRGFASVPAVVHRTPRSWVFELLVMHAGRLTTYMLLGALMGAVGATAWKQEYLPLQRWLYALGSALLVLSGLWLLRGKVPRAVWVEKLATGGAQYITRHCRVIGAHMPAGLRRRPGPLARRYGMGLAWGIVPCGMVYGALALALLAGNAASGALVMGAFGLGTLPNLLVISGLSGYLRHLSRRRAVRVIAGVIVMAFGLLGIARAFWLPDTLNQIGFCMVL
ncbi:sulfite exporter TauE/SafE family protein [Cupriavidus sp. YR651]|uniref:sulfite exporter TauE/SafE family protein n=1 Tax=Cupriavidus sp. YR651 TaxID=1855315 RepID=UPI000B8671B9|nr:sulfite exporter TauE/SafE family protein [Cupriavidus sp. YR651]